MTGFKQDPLRQSADEIRFDEAEQERLDMHEEYLRRVNASTIGTGISDPPARVGARSTPVTIYQGRPADFDPSLGSFSKHWTSDIRVAQNFGPNIYAAQIQQSTWDASQAATLQANPNIDPRNVAMGLERHLPLSYAQGAFPVSVATGVPAPALTPPQAMPAATPPARIGNPWGPPVPSQQEMLAQRLRGLQPAEVTNVETMAATTQRVGTGINRALGLPGTSASLGELQFRTTPQGPMPSQYVDPSTGEITVSGRHIRGAQQALASAYSGIMERGRGMDPKMLSANLTRALGEAGQKYVKEVEQEGTRAAGRDPGAEFGARAITNRVRQMVGKIAYSIVDQTEKAQGGVGGQDIQRGAQRMGLEDLRRMATGEMGPLAQTAAQGAIAQGGGWGAVAAGGISGGGPGTGIGAFSVAGAGGSQWVPGGPLGGAGGGGGGRRGMWQGDLGGLMYGAYIAKRFWSYTGAPAMQAMGEYAGAQAGLEPLMTGRVPQEGAAAYQAQRGIGQYMLGQGAYNVVGGAMSMSARALQAPGMGTLVAGASIFGGAALGMGIMGRSLGQLGGGMGRVGGFLRGAAPAVAALGLAQTIGAAGASQYQEMTGRDVNAFGMMGAAAQSVARFGTGIGLIAGATGASLIGQGEEYADWLGGRNMMDPDRFINRKWGVDVSGSGMAGAQDIAGLAGELNVAPGDVSEMLAGAIGMTGQQGLGGGNRGLIATINRLRQTRGISTAGATGIMGGYAEALGYLPGEQGFDQAANMFGGMPLEQQSQMMRAAQSRAGQAGQFRQVISRDVIGDPSLRGMMGAFGTQQIGQIAFGGVSQLIAGGMGQRQAMTLGLQGGMAVSAGLMTENQFQGGMGMAAMMGDYMGPSAVRSGAIMQAYGGMGQGQMNLAGRIAGGDMNAMSFAANTGALPGFEGMALTDLSGAPTYMGNLQQGMMNLNQVAGQMGMGAGGIYQGAPGMGQMGRFQQAFQAAGGGGAGMGAGLRGIGVGESMAGFFEQNPQAGLTDYQREFSNQQFGRQMAGIGIGQQRIQMQRQFQYGGGDWRNPSEGSLWGIQDRMRALQWQGQQAGAAFSLERMDTGNQFGMRQEDLSGRRMGMQQDYQRWGMGFQRAGMDLSRQFTRENRQYQDQLRGMSTAFTLEDFGENIRMASGRQRRQLVTQRERFVSMTGVQDEQTERQREQQEEMWAREDEQFEKKREYMEQTMALDEEQFNMNIERRETLFEMDRGDLERRIELAEQLHELQDEQMEKQREYAVAQMDLAEKALGIQAASAIAQKEYNDSMLALYDETIKPVGDTIDNIATNDPVPMLKALEDMAKAMNEMGTSGAQSLEDLASTVGNLNSGGIRTLIRDLQTLMATAGWH